MRWLKRLLFCRFLGHDWQGGVIRDEEDYAEWAETHGESNCSRCGEPNPEYIQPKVVDQ